MAQKNTFFGRLRRLFSTNVIVRNIGGRKLKVADTDKRQTYRNSATNFLYDKYSRLRSSMYADYHYNQRASFNARREELFADYEGMDADPIISSALDIYCDESSMKNEYDEVLKISSKSENIQDILHNLFYDVLNVEFNLWPWIRNLVKYGDFYLKLDIAENFGVINVQPLPIYEVERFEGEDPEHPYDVYFELEGEGTGPRTKLQNYEVAHFRLLSDSNFLPYGKSMLEGARRVWKQMTLMEDAMLIHRIMRAPEKRVFKLDIGNIPPNEVDNYMQQVINKMKKTPYIDQSTGDYNLRYNIQNITEDFFLPVRGGDSGTSIENLSGIEYSSIDDIEYLRNKLMSALKIPKAFLGYEENVNAKATLAAEDVRFARTIERIQKIVVSELTKIAVVHLYSQGFEDKDLVDFELELTKSSTIAEEEKIALWNEKISLAASMTQDSLMSTDWIYQNIFDLSEDAMEELRNGIIEDQKRVFRHEQIKMEGNDPVKTEQSFGTPHDLAVLQMQGQENLGQGTPKAGNPIGAPAEEVDVPDGGWVGAGRPKEPNKYKTDKHPRGRDPLGSKGNKPEKRVRPISLEQVKNIVDDIPKFKRKKSSILKETFGEKVRKNEIEATVDMLKESKILNPEEISENSKILPMSERNLSFNRAPKPKKR